MASQKFRFEPKWYSKAMEEAVNLWIDDNIANKSYTVINDTLKKKNIQEIVDCWNELYEENERLKQDLNEYCNFSLHTILDKKNKKIEMLQSTLAYRSNQLALMEQLINDLGHEEMKRQMEEILND